MLSSFLLNCLIVAMVTFGFAAMFCGWNFMGKVGELDDAGFIMFRYFTIDSNVLAGICSLIMACAEGPVLLGRAAELPSWVYVVKLMGSAAVLLTFAVTVCFLMPQFEEPLSMFYNSNLFFHLLVPLVAAGSFVLAEKTDSISFGMTIAGVIPTFFYAVFYLVSVFTHLTNGKPDKKYDFYNFLNGEIRRTPVVIIVVLGVSYLLSLLLWWGNGITF